MTSLILGVLACRGPAPPPPPSATPPPTAPEPSADWSPTDLIGGAVFNAAAAQLMAEGSTTGQTHLHDSVSGQDRPIVFEHPAGQALPVDSRTAHWLVASHDGSTNDPLVVDYTVSWTPRPEKHDNPSIDTTIDDFSAGNPQLQSVAGVDRWTWVKDGDYYVRHDAP